MTTPWWERYATGSVYECYAGNRDRPDDLHRDAFMAHISKYHKELYASELAKSWRKHWQYQDACKR